jgi:hypothetical protein
LGEVVVGGQGQNNYSTNEDEEMEKVSWEIKLKIYDFVPFG